MSEHHQSSTSVLEKPEQVERKVQSSTTLFGAKLFSCLSVKWKTILWTFIGIIFWLGVFEASAQWFMSGYDDQKLLNEKVKGSGGKVALYLARGLSVEKKLRIGWEGRFNKKRNPHRAGWLDPRLWADKPQDGEKGLIAAYGQSFTFYAMGRLKELVPEYETRVITGPSAPPNHSFAAFNLDRNLHSAEVCVLGLLSGTIKGLLGMSSAGYYWHTPLPFTFPRYRVVNGELVSEMPLIRTQESWDQALKDPLKLEPFLKQIETHDNYFSSVGYRSTWLDSLILGRIVQKGFNGRKASSVQNKFIGPQGFKEDSELVVILQAIVKEFARVAREDGRLPIVLLFHGRGEADHLYQMIYKTLEENQIPYVSSHGICSPWNPDVFISKDDGHLKPHCNKEIVRQMLEIIATQSDGKASQMAKKRLNEWE